MGPSSMVSDLHFPQKCISCRELPATLKWSKGWQMGNDLCRKCWREEVGSTLGIERDYYVEDRDE